MDKDETRMNIIASGEKVYLRDRHPSDAKIYVNWFVNGEWKEYDAPWENIDTPDTEEKKDIILHRFLEDCKKDLPMPRTKAIITTTENKPLGWVNRYKRGEHFPDTWFVGIDICEDEYLNKGMGTEALELWIDYLFSNSNVHRLSLDTWSFNKRMMHVAEKVGFVLEGKQREFIKWKDEWLDAVHYGMLRREWEEKLSEI
ncbi:MAG: GNAT family N-acetyltransferase [Ignavibacteria bacterium]|nr:GNAT family N-acetyltransferase [Ignavibacteria bacterium]